MIRKTLMIAAGLLGLIVLVATPASAGDPYTPMNATATVNPDNSVTLTGDNCPPNAPVTYVVRRGSANNSGNSAIVDQGGGTSNADGAFSITTNPLSNGRYNLTVTCGGESAVLGVQIGPVQSSAGGKPAQQAGVGNLAETGSESIPMARLGMILVATGGVAVYAAKKRQGRRAAFINA